MKVNKRHYISIDFGTAYIKLHFLLYREGSSRLEVSRTYRTVFEFDFRQEESDNGDIIVPYLYFSGTSGSSADSYIEAFKIGLVKCLEKGEKEENFEDENNYKWRYKDKSGHVKYREFFKAMFDFVIIRIKKIFDEESIEFNKNFVCFVLTFPAGCVEYYKLYESCAGEYLEKYGTVYMTSEPSASAYYMEHYCSMSSGSYVVVCDHGGGTMHLSLLFKPAQNLNQPFIVVDQLTDCDHGGFKYEKEVESRSELIRGFLKVVKKKLDIWKECVCSKVRCHMSEFIYTGGTSLNEPIRKEVEVLAKQYVDNFLCIHGRHGYSSVQTLVAEGACLHRMFTHDAIYISMSSVDDVDEDFYFRVHDNQLIDVRDESNFNKLDKYIEKSQLSESGIRGDKVRVFKSVGDRYHIVEYNKDGKSIA